MPRHSDALAGYKRAVTMRLKKLGLTQKEAIKLFEELYTIDWYLQKIDETAERMILYGDEWAKDDHPHARHARASAVGMLQPEAELFGVDWCRY